MSKLKKNLRNNALRVALVEALIKGSGCVCNEMCTCESYSDLIRLAELCGVDFAISGTKRLKHLDPTLVTRKQEDAMYVLSTLNEFKQFSYDNIFRNFGEFPEGAYPAYEFFQAQTRDGFNLDQSSSKRQALFILVSLALQDSYMNHFVDSYGDPAKTAWDLWCELLSSFSSNEQPPQLPPSITNQIVRGGSWTKHFSPGGHFDAVAGYSLEMGLSLAENHDETRDTSDFLTPYLELQPDQHYFCYSEHANQGGVYGGFIVRANGLLVSHQIFVEAGQLKFDIFNEYLAAHLRTPPESRFDHVIVLYSRYRQYAQIFSKDPRSWDPNTPIETGMRIPDGYGLVGSWWPLDEGDAYTPRSLEQLDSPIYTAKLRAAARYLEACLSRDV